MQDKKNFTAFLLPRLQDMFFICVLLACIYYGDRLFNLDGDLGRHITVGNYILENKAFPTRDIFSHSMNGQPLVPHEWLAQTLFSAAHSLLGLSGVVLLTSVSVAAAFTLAYREVISRGAFRLTALGAALWAAMASSLHWLARPHIFTFLFLALWAYQLEHAAERKSNHIGSFPLLMLLWVNMHGAFIAGFVVLGAHIAEWLWEFSQRRADMAYGRTLFIISISSFAVTIINPAGFRLWRTSLGFIGNNYLVDHTVEYMPPDFHAAATWPFLFMLAFFLFSLSRGTKIKLREAILLAGWAVMALYSARNIPLFAIVAAPILGTLIQSSAGKMQFLTKQDEGLKMIENRLRGILFPVIVILFLAFASALNLKAGAASFDNRYDPAVFPVNAVDWLDENPQAGNVFNDFTWGGYLLYREWPALKVFIDGQTDFYGEALTREYEQAVSVSKGWETVFDKYNIEWAILPVDSALAQKLEVEQHWRVLFKDSTAVILRK
jgi:hypothetical protein